MPKHLVAEIEKCLSKYVPFFTAEPGELFEFVPNVDYYGEEIAVYIGIIDDEHIFSLLITVSDNNEYGQELDYYRRMMPKSNIDEMSWYYADNKNIIVKPPDTGLFKIADYSMRNSKYRKIGKVSDELLKALSHGVLAHLMAEIIEK